MLRQKILFLYLSMNYNFFKLKKIIEREFEENIEKTIDKIYRKMNVNETEISKKYNFQYDLIEKNFITFVDDDFPSILYENSAGVIFYRGNLNLLTQKFFRISIVGSRKPLEVTSFFTLELVKKLVSLQDVVIVSGLATGVDTIALKTAIENNIKTIAVLGNGIDYYYPYSNKDLHKKISQSGLIFSEYINNQSPKKYFFPYRNRIISAISDIVVVIQASKVSGSIITGKYALEMGKTLLVPFLSLSEEFEGSKELINSGATMITKPNEILDYLPYTLTKKQEEQNNDDELLNLIIKNPGINVEQLSNLLNLPVPKVLELVTLLELENKIYIDFNYSIFAI